MNPSRSSPALTRAGANVLGASSPQDTNEGGMSNSRSSEQLHANYNRDVEIAQEMNWPTIVAPSKEECEADMKEREERYNRELSEIAIQTSAEQRRKDEAWQKYERDRNEWENMKDQHQLKMDLYAKSLEDRVVAGRPSAVSSSGGQDDSELQEAIRQSLAVISSNEDDAYLQKDTFYTGNSHPLTTNDLDDLEKALLLSTEEATSLEETTLTGAKTISKKEEDAILEEVLQLSLLESKADTGDFKESLSQWNQTFKDQSTACGVATGKGDAESVKPKGSELKLSEWNKKFKQMKED